MRRRLALVLTALCLVSLAFVIRFNALGGSMGGFDDDEFVTLLRIDMALDGQKPGRDFADNELRGVWPSLAFELPALAQRAFGRTLLVHAWYTLGALALCLVLALILADRLSGRWTAALLAAVLIFLCWTVPYNYQKLLSMTFGIVAIWWAVGRECASRSVAAFAPAALATLVAGLFRHDYALFVGAGALAGIMGVQPRPWFVPMRRTFAYGALVLLVSTPSLIWLSLNGGIVHYLQRSVIASLTQSATNPPMAFRPRIDPSAPLATDSLTAFVYYACWALVLVAAAILVFGLPKRRPHEDDTRRGMGWALIAMAVPVHYFLLRSTLQARFGDAIVPAALIGPWIVGIAPVLASPGARLLARIGPLALMALMCAALVPVEEVTHELGTGGFLREPLTTVPARFGQVRRELAALPPHDWTGMDTRNGVMAAARYVDECTSPDAHVFVGAFAEPVAYFSNRRFAAGQSYFAFSFLTTDADQRLALDRLSHQSVPIAFTAFDFENEITKNYPLVAQHLMTHYRQVGVIDFDGAPWLRVFVENDRVALRTDPVLGFPCFR